MNDADRPHTPRIDHLRLVVPARDAAAAERLGRAVAEELRRTPLRGDPARALRVAVGPLDPHASDGAIAAATVRAVQAELATPRRSTWP